MKALHLPTAIAPAQGAGRGQTGGRLAEAAAVGNRVPTPQPVATTPNKPVRRSFSLSEGLMLLRGFEQHLDRAPEDEGAVTAMPAAATKPEMVVLGSGDVLTEALITQGFGALRVHLPSDHVVTRTLGPTGAHADAPAQVE